VSSERNTIFDPDVEQVYKEKPFTETVSDGFKLFALASIGWFLIAFIIVKRMSLFENLDTFSLGGKIALAISAGVPLILAAIVLVRFYWWFSVYLSHTSHWGRDLGWPRYFWFAALVIATFVYVDPLDNITRNIANAMRVNQFVIYGIPEFNPVQVMFKLAGLLLLLLLSFHYLKEAAIAAWNWTKDAWEMAVSFPQGLSISLQNFLRPNICVEYPEHKDTLPEHFRGRHILASDANGKHLCIACRACERVCPDRLILISAVRNPETKKQELTGFLLDNSRCCYCALCEDSCPTDAVRHTPNCEYSCYDRSELVLDLFGEYKDRTAEVRAKHGGADVS
jgi:NADH-quinone oxidoreductase subunit I